MDETMGRIWAVLISFTLIYLCVTLNALPGAICGILAAVTVFASFFIEIRRVDPDDPNDDDDDFTPV